MNEREKESFIVGVGGGKTVMNYTEQVSMQMQNLNLQLEIHQKLKKETDDSRLRKHYNYVINKIKNTIKKVKKIEATFHI